MRVIPADLGDTALDRRGADDEKNGQQNEDPAQAESGAAPCAADWMSAVGSHAATVRPRSNGSLSAH
jgi:hypothetical protein